MDVSIDPDRLRERFDRYSAIGATEDGGLHRVALTDADAAVRDAFVADLRALDLSVRIDELGNVFGRRPGRTEDPPVLLGSHLDSQPCGGRFDGQLGVVIALETVAMLDKAGVETDRPIEVVNWTNEEGARFQPSMLGSGTFVGKYAVEEALSVTDADGVSVGEELERIGYAGEAPCRPFEIHSFLELHVEQGPKLEAAGVPVGVVEGVFGFEWLRATVRGRSDHAGPTPMHERRDAMAAAADAISAIGAIPNRLSADAVVTVGEVTVEPNSINVIPNRVRFTVDTRSADREVVRTAVDRVAAELHAACDRHGVTSELDELSITEPIEFATTIRETIAAAAESRSISARPIVSGAGHDAQHLHQVTDAGMLFVPSVDGRTHAEAEFTAWADVVDGATVFADAAYELAMR